MKLHAQRLAEHGGTVVDSLEELMATCDIIVATTGVAGLIKPEMVRKGQIILALSNPNAEISPEDALAAGAAFAADGRLVNNILVSRVFSAVHSMHMRKKLPIRCLSQLHLQLSTARNRAILSHIHLIQMSTIMLQLRLNELRNF